jgi:3-hydroxyisobutyryl-CoA hydrolase
VTAVLVDKIKERPHWAPAHLTQVSDNFIQENFFDSTSKYLQKMPTLSPPVWLQDATPSNPMKYALPREEEIGQVVKGADSTSHSFAITREELVEKFEQRRRGKAGVKEKVHEVVKRRCRVESDSDGKGWLVWKTQ